jgi:hypothetical protein
MAETYSIIASIRGKEAVIAVGLTKEAATRRLAQLTQSLRVNRSSNCIYRIGKEKP